MRWHSDQLTDDAICSDGYACLYPDCCCPRKDSSLDDETAAQPSSSDGLVDTLKAELDISPGGGHPEYRNVLFERMALHIEKSAGYGTGDDPFANFTAVAHMTGEPRYLYPVLRTIEKLTRVLSLHSQGRTSELEEEFMDCSSLLDCATAMAREDSKESQR